MKFASSILLLVGTASALAPALNAGSRSSALSAKPKVFIVGEAGTTGTQVSSRLEKRDDLEIISPPADLRKDPATRKKFINDADAVILCTSHVVCGWLVGWLLQEENCDWSTVMTPNLSFCIDLYKKYPNIILLVVVTQQVSLTMHPSRQLLG